MEPLPHALEVRRDAAVEHDAADARDDAADDLRIDPLARAAPGRRSRGRARRPARRGVAGSSGAAVTTSAGTMRCCLSSRSSNARRRRRAAAGVALGEQHEQAADFRAQLGRCLRSAPRRSRASSSRHGRLSKHRCSSRCRRAALTPRDLPAGSTPDRPGATTSNAAPRALRDAANRDRHERVSATSSRVHRCNGARWLAGRASRAVGRGLRARGKTTIYTIRLRRRGQAELTGELLEAVRQRRRDSASPDSTRPITPAAARPLV